MRIVCLSDTHSRTLENPIPDGDILIHAGDATVTGGIDEINSFAYWFYSLPHRYKIFVAGNHDWLYYRNPTLANTFVKSLHDKLIEIEGLKIYGSSWQPELHNWAFGLPRGKHLEKVWRKAGTSAAKNYTNGFSRLSQNFMFSGIYTKDTDKRSWME